MSRWSMQHEIWKNGNTLSAVIIVDGAWMDTRSRKLAVPPAQMQQAFEAIPKAAAFMWMEG